MVLFWILFCFVLREGGMGWRLCVLFGYKFEAVRDISVEVFGKVVYKYKKLREVWVEEK